MADKQLTVAELMARAQKENPDAEAAPRRRRRRSLEEGGVSVAELTGSMKAVDARPAEVKHSSQPIDAENADRPEPTAPAEPAPAEPVTPAEPENTVTLSKFRPAQPEAEQPEAKPTEAEQTEHVTLRKVSFADRTDTPVEPVEEATVVSRPVEVREETKPTFVEEPEEPAQPAEPEPAEPSIPFNEDTDETNVIPVVEDAPPAQAALTTPVEKRPVERPVEDVEEPHTEPAFEDLDPAAEPDNAEHAPEPVYEDVAAYDGEVEDASVNPIMLVLLVFAGLILGVLVFLGFQYLWASLNPILVGVMALAATAAIVLLVRGMKTGRDGLTLTLAGLAGAVMTFGPALISTL